MLRPLTVLVLLMAEPIVTDECAADDAVNNHNTIFVAPQPVPCDLLFSSGQEPVVGLLTMASKSVISRAEQKSNGEYVEFTDGLQLIWDIEAEVREPRKVRRGSRYILCPIILGD